MADYGMRVSQAGFDVLADSDSKMILTSKNKTFKVILIYNTQISIPANATDSVDQWVTVFPGTAFYLNPILFLDTGSKKLVSNAGAKAAVDYIGCDVWGSSSGQILIRANRTSSSSTWPGAVTFNAKVYVVVV